MNIKELLKIRIHFLISGIEFFFQSFGLTFLLLTKEAHSQGEPMDNGSVHSLLLFHPQNPTGAKVCTPVAALGQRGAALGRLGEQSCLQSRQPQGAGKPERVIVRLQRGPEMLAGQGHLCSKAGPGHVGTEWRRCLGEGALSSGCL